MPTLQSLSVSIRSELIIVMEAPSDAFTHIRKGQRAVLCTHVALAMGNHKLKSVRTELVVPAGSFGAMPRLVRDEGEVKWSKMQWDDYMCLKLWIILSLTNRVKCIASTLGYFGTHA